MILRRVKDRSGAEWIEALHNSRWRRLYDCPSLSVIKSTSGVKGNLEKEILPVLQLGVEFWSLLNKELELCSPVDEEASFVILPFQPASFRDFMFYEKHYVDAARGHVKRYMPKAYRFLKFYEKVLGRIFPSIKPNSMWYEKPIYYYGNHLNFITDGDLIEWPEFIVDLDYELELGAVVAHSVHDVNVNDAKDSIGGFVIINDLSARGNSQKREMDSGFGPQTCKHFNSVMSSVVVTSDEVAPVLDKLSARVLINNKLVSESSTSGAKFRFEEAISIISRSQRLYPGELLGSGTLPGGSGLESGHWLRPGDRLTFEVDAIGKLENVISM